MATRPFVPTPGAVNLRFHFGTTFNAQTWSFSIKAVTSDLSVPTTAALSGIAQHGYNWITTGAGSVMNHLCHHAKLVEVTAQDMSSTTSPIGQYIPTSAPSGGLPDNLQPLQNALVVSQRTALRGRSYRGRWYLTGLGVGSYSETSGYPITDSDTGGWLTALNTELGLATPVPLAVVVVSLYTGGHKPVPSAPRPAGITTRVTGWFTDHLNHTQRRRGQI